MKGFCRTFSYDSFHVRVRQIIPKLILHTIFNTYPHINFINKGMSVFIKLMCNMTHHKSFGLVLTYFNEVRKHIVYILDGKLFSCNNRYRHDII